MTTPRASSNRPRRILAATMHAEQLQDDHVWALVRDLLSHWGRRGRPWTIFVQPLRARAAGVDLRPRLDWLGDNGHEIAMHTHYYRLSHAPGAAPVFTKEAELEPNSVRRCLDEDHAYLVELGHSPIGFVAGAWIMHDVVPEWLTTHGFRYDSSRRAFRLGYDNPAARTGDNHFTVTRVNGLIHIPTTTTVRRLATTRARGGRQEVRLDDDSSYEMFYLHDYDLVRLRPRLAVRLIDQLARADSFQPVAALADVAARAVAPEQPPGSAPADAST